MLKDHKMLCKSCTEMLTTDSHGTESPNQKISCSIVDSSRDWHLFIWHSKAMIISDALLSTLSIMADVHFLFWVSYAVLNNVNLLYEFSSSFSYYYMSNRVSLFVLDFFVSFYNLTYYKKSLLCLFKYCIAHGAPSSFLNLDCCTCWLYNQSSVFVCQEPLE